MNLQNKDITQITPISVFSAEPQPLVLKGRVAFFKMVAEWLEVSDLFSLN